MAGPSNQYGNRTVFRELERNEAQAGRRGRAGVHGLVDDARMVAIAERTLSRLWEGP
jgi:hypothetical protein